MNRILILTTSYLPNIGGSELAIREITKRLPDIEFDIITSRADSQGRFAPERAPAETQDNTNIYRIGNSFTLARFLLPKNFFPISAFFKAVSLHRKFRYEIIHAYQASQAGGAAWLFKLFHPRVKFILTIQEGKNLKGQGWFLNFFRDIMVRSADSITVISRYLKEYAAKINHRAVITLIPNGVDLKKFSGPARSREARQISNEKIIITVSRLVEKNGLADLVDAFALVKKDIPTAKLVIIGEGSLKEKLKLKIKNLKLEGSIRLAGQVAHEELSRYLSAADIFVRPSLSEGLGTAFLEAMACGLPVIGTPVGGIPDIIHDGQTGLMCRSGDPNDIADKIRALLTDSGLRERLGRAGQEMVRVSYDWNKIAGQFANIYHD